jgi:2-amino-4-hydroxy-6-hydroxymethyldihydropteridine diphosphokinase
LEPVSSEVVLLLGSNLGDRERHLRNGIAALSGSVTVTALSRIHESEPFGPVPQPWYLNVAIRGITNLGPEDLLFFLKAIEKDEGRVGEGPRWGPRTLDIDIILMGDLVVRTHRWPNDVSACCRFRKSQPISRFRPTD